MKWNIGHADPNVYNIPIYENPRPTSIPLFCSNFNTFIVEKKKRLRIERIELFEAWRGEDGKLGELKSH